MSNHFQKMYLQNWEFVKGIKRKISAVNNQYKSICINYCEFLLCE